MWARLKSRNRLSNLVSSSTWTVSVTPRGKGASAFAITTTDSAITSYAGGGGVSPSFSFGGRFSDTLPVNWRVDSRVILCTMSNDSSPTLSALRKIWVLPVPSRRSTKHIAPLPRLASMKPATVTSLSIKSAPLACISPNVCVR